MKKLISLVMIIALALSLCIFASATETTGETLPIASNPNAETTETTEAPAEDAAETTEKVTEDAAEEEVIEEEVVEEEGLTARKVIRIALTVIQVLAAVGLVAVVSMQAGKSSGLGATMSGSAETFMSKNQTASKEAMLAKITKIVGVVFILLTLVLNVLQAA